MSDSSLFQKYKVLEVFAHNKYFFVNDEPFWESVINGKWEPHTFRIIQKFTDLNHSMIDIGAWIGPTTLFGCQVSKYCYSFEPDPVAYKKLIYNINLNPSLKSKISAYNAAIGVLDGEIDFYSASTFGDSRSSMVLKESEKKVKAQSIMFETFIEQENITDLNFIKMDIEGGELPVLINIKQFLARTKPTIFLSLHPFLFRDPNEYVCQIMPTIDLYKDIFNNIGDKVPRQALIDYLLSDPHKQGCEVVLTDRVKSISLE